MDMDIYYKNKYLKYKNKYINIKKKYIKQYNLKEANIDVIKEKEKEKEIEIKTPIKLTMPLRQTQFNIKEKLYNDLQVLFENNKL